MSGTILTVGPGQQYQTIAAAIEATHSIPGSVTIEITAGTYFNDGGYINSNNVTVEGVGGIVKIIGPSPGAGGVAAFSTSGANNIFANLDISGVAGGAGILIEGGYTFIENDKIHDNQEGIQCNGYNNNTVSVFGSDIGHNGINVDVGNIASLHITNSVIHDAQGGDEVKSRAAGTWLFNDIVADNGSNAAYTIDLPNGGTIGIGDSMLQKGPASSAGSIISLGSGGSSISGTDLYVGDDYVINDRFPATNTLLDHPVSHFDRTAENFVWNVPDLGGGLVASPTTFEVLSTRAPLKTYADVFKRTDPTITTITGNRDGGVTIAGNFLAGCTVTVAETIHDTTTLLGSATADSIGHFTLTSHARIDQTTLHSYTVSGFNADNHIFSMQGALFLTDTGADHLTSTPDAGNVFAVMSFKGSDIIDDFKTTSAAGAIHDVIDFSGRGITNFAQVQAMMSGTASTVLTMASGKTVTLEGVNPTNLSASDFVYS